VTLSVKLKLQVIITTNKSEIVCGHYLSWKKTHYRTGSVVNFGNSPSR